MHICVCRSMWRTGVGIRYRPQSLSTLVFETGSLIEPRDNLCGKRFTKSSLQPSMFFFSHNVIRFSISYDCINFLT